MAIRSVAKHTTRAWCRTPIPDRNVIAAQPGVGIVDHAAERAVDRDPRQDQAGAGARAVASAAEAICATAGDGEAETAGWGAELHVTTGGTLPTGEISLAP
jgi:hypothetical protein